MNLFIPPSPSSWVPNKKVEIEIEIEKISDRKRQKLRSRGKKFVQQLMESS